MNNQSNTSIFRRVTSVGVLCIALLGSFGCSSKPSDLDPVIKGAHKTRAIYYPSTDFKVAAVVVTESGDVIYFRANGLGQKRDEVLLFNVRDFAE